MAFQARGSSHRGVWCDLGLCKLGRRPLGISMHERGGKGEKGGLGSMSVRPQPPPGGAATLVRWQPPLKEGESKLRKIARLLKLPCLDGRAKW